MPDNFQGVDSKYLNDFTESLLFSYSILFEHIINVVCNIYR